MTVTEYIGRLDSKQAAQARYAAVSDVAMGDLRRWLPRLNSVSTPSSYPATSTVTRASSAYSSSCGAGIDR
jgi:hypothetical protein